MAPRSACCGWQRPWRTAGTRSVDALLAIASNSSVRPYEAPARELGIRERVDLVMSPSFGDLPRLLANADIALNPQPDCDGVPVKLLNYMAAAQLAVSFKGSVPGVTHGVDGWLAANGDVVDFAASVVALLQDPARAQAIGQAARDYVEKNCSWPMAAVHCERIYESLRARMT